jgi:hypothetical protein
MAPDSRLLKLTDFVKSVKERRDRQVAAQRAMIKAKERAAAREQFRPVGPPTGKPLKLKF